VRGFEISQLDQLVAGEIRVSFGDNQMSFAFVDPNAGRKLWSVHAGSIYYNAGGNSFTVCQPNAVDADPRNREAASYFDSIRIKKVLRCSQLINNPITSDEQSARESFT